ncbi:MAG: lysine--tRNA ligase [Legionellales bacterium]|jgi:lysyl-tRNA synthetase class 2
MEHDQSTDRIAKLAQLRAQGQAYPNDFKREHLAQDLHDAYQEKDAAFFESHPVAVKLAGRIMTRRMMGKASFVHIQDMSGQMQLYIKQETLPQDLYEQFKTWDLGDIIGVEGHLFKTKTNELSVKATNIRLLAKSLHPMPDKFHGLVDHEARARQRYLDLICNEDTRKVFKARSQILKNIRDFMSGEGFTEVETPMMQAIAGGAAAKPFVTHHNALDMNLFLRIAPELYLKRLVVGGFEKVYEINRNFRNEGVSTRHNPEFTMIEWYQAYATYIEAMEMTENFIRYAAQNTLGTLQIVYQEKTYDLSVPFKRISVVDSIVERNPDVKHSELATLESARALAQRLSIPIEKHYGLGKVQIEIFEKTVEPYLFEPTFITEYPAEVSPLARPNDENPFITDRFELFIAGRELANGFSELNDAQEQARIFRAQSELKANGDEEAMSFDQDFITALEYGMPPTAGVGVGIDRLVMFLTDAMSIRDVLLFPHMRSVE